MYNCPIQHNFIVKQPKIKVQFLLNVPLDDGGRKHSFFPQFFDGMYITRDERYKNKGYRCLYSWKEYREFLSHPIEDYPDENVFLVVNNYVFYDTLYFSQINQGRSAVEFRYVSQNGLFNHIIRLPEFERILLSKIDVNPLSGYFTFMKQGAYYSLQYLGRSVIK